ncbi:MAG: tRNA preQ1(34) S-adenosylmethionine ribosyltransferase-isomerase QueA [Candidatus Woesearchaeota archaeon]
MFQPEFSEKDLYLSNYDYVLPKELIAQEPLPERDQSRLLMIFNNGILHTKFTEIVKFFQAGDVLVFNNTRVLKTKLKGKKESGANATITLIEKKDDFCWLCFVHTKNPKVGTKLIFEGNQEKLIAEIVSQEENKFVLKFNSEINEFLNNYGSYTLPPYIKKELKEQERYQSIFAKEDGSLASPTASLHFSERIIKELEKKGVKFAYVTLNISLGTFAPVTENYILNHKIHSEIFKITKENAEIIKSAKRLFVVGTTSLRVLESLEKFEENYGSTNIFIYPSYQFKHQYHGLITNFHLPKSTLIMLVSAIVGRERILRIYTRAVELNYRFFSLGDATFIVNDSFREDFNLIGTFEEI